MKSILSMNIGKLMCEYKKLDELKEAELKELKKTAESLGLVPKKVGTPYWSVRS